MAAISSMTARPRAPISAAVVRLAGQTLQDDELTAELARIALRHQHAGDWQTFRVEEIEQLGFIGKR